MPRNYTFSRQEAEDLVDFLEEHPDRMIHDKTAAELAKELRELFGMCPREEESK